MTKKQAVVFLHQTKMLSDLVQSMKKTAAGAFDAELDTLQDAVAGVAVPDNWVDIFDEPGMEPTFFNDIHAIDGDTADVLPDLAYRDNPQAHPLVLTFGNEWPKTNPKHTQTYNRWVCLYITNCYTMEQCGYAEKDLPDTKTVVKSVIDSFVGGIDAQVENMFYEGNTPVMFE